MQVANNKKNIIKTLVTNFTAVFISISYIVLAQDDGAAGVTEASIDLNDFIAIVAQIIYPIAVIYAIIMIIIAGYKIMSAQNDAQKLKDGQADLTNAIFGFLFVILSGVLLAIIFGLFGIETTGGSIGSGNTNF